MMWLAYSGRTNWFNGIHYQQKITMKIMNPAAYTFIHMACTYIHMYIPYEKF